MSAKHPTPRQQAWRYSDRFKQIGKATLRIINDERRKAAVCGAKCKRTGEPCQTPGLANGRCRVHGGVTPKGDAWHVTQWPSRESSRVEQRIQSKLRVLEKRRKAKAARLAAMTPEERARHELWHRRHKPGKAAARARACNEVRDALEARERIERYADTGPKPSELAELLVQAARVQARVQDRLAKRREQMEAREGSDAEG